MVSSNLTPTFPERGARRVTVTWFTDNEESMDIFLQSDLWIYACAAWEECPTTSRKHLQAYGVAKNCIRLSTLRNAFPGAAFLQSRGTHEENIAYTRKDREVDIANGTPCNIEDNWKEEGERPSTMERLRGMFYNLATMDNFTEEMDDDLGLGDKELLQEVISQLTEDLLYISIDDCNFDFFIDSDLDGDVSIDYMDDTDEDYMTIDHPQ